MEDPIKDILKAKKEWAKHPGWHYNETSKR